MNNETLLSTFSTILVLAPHTDDGELGCGGVIHKLISEGKKVIYVAFSICEESVPEGFPKDVLGVEVKNATKVLGIPSEDLIIKNYKVRKFSENRQSILEDLVALNKQYKPDLVFCPSSFDQHQDHQTIANESKRAFKNTSIMGYEFVWNTFEFKTTCFIALNENNVVAKVDSLKQYKSQGFRTYTSEDSIRTMLKFRGLQIKRKFAESFELIRLILD